MLSSRQNAANYVLDGIIASLAHHAEQLKARCFLSVASLMHSKSEANFEAHIFGVQIFGGHRFMVQKKVNCDGIAGKLVCTAVTIARTEDLTREQLMLLMNYMYTMLYNEWRLFYLNYANIKQKFSKIYL